MLHATIQSTIIHDIFQYIQTSDPGAVGARIAWLDTTNPLVPIWKRRNEANDAWIVMGGGGGGSVGSIKWEPATIETLLGDTQLAPAGTGIASGVGTVLGAEYDNGDTGNRYMFGMFQLDVTFGSSPTAGTLCTLYLIPATDGTNYNDGGGTVRPQNAVIGSFAMRAVNTQQRVTFIGIPLPPTKFKIFLVNGTDQAFPNSGSTVKMVPYGQAIV
jgi:hypothetical protein